MTTSNDSQPRAAGEAAKLSVQFRSLGQSKREWRVDFDLGDNERNAAAALDYALKHNAEVVKSAAGEAAQTPLFLYVGSLRAAMAALIANKQPMPVQHMRDYLASLRDLHQDALNAYDSDQRKIKALTEALKRTACQLELVRPLGDGLRAKASISILNEAQAALALAKEDTRHE